MKKKKKEIEKPESRNFFFNLWNTRLVPMAMAAAFAIGVVTTPLINFFTRTAPQIAPVFRGGEETNQKNIDFDNLTIGDKFEDVEGKASWEIIKKYTTDADGICLLTIPYNATIFNQGSIYEFCSSGRFKVFHLTPADEPNYEPRMWMTPDNSPDYIGGAGF